MPSPEFAQEQILAAKSLYRLGKLVAHLEGKLSGQLASRFTELLPDRRMHGRIILSHGIDSDKTPTLKVLVHGWDYTGDYTKEMAFIEVNQEGEHELVVPGPKRQATAEEITLFENVIDHVLVRPGIAERAEKRQTKMRKDLQKRTKQNARTAGELARILKFKK